MNKLEKLLFNKLNKKAEDKEYQYRKIEMVSKDKYKMISQYDFERIKIKIKEQQQKLDKYKNIVDELEKDILDYFKKEYPDRKIENYNLKNCTYDYALVILGKLKELKGE